MNKEVTLKNEARVAYLKQTIKVVAFKTDSFSNEHLEQISFCLNEFFRLVCSLNDANQRIPRVVLCTFDSFTIRSYLRIDQMENQFDLINEYLRSISKRLNVNLNQKHRLEKRNIVQELLNVAETGDDKNFTDNQFELFIIGFNCNPQLNEIKKHLAQLKDKSVLKKAWLLNAYKANSDVYQSSLFDSFDENEPLIELLNLYLGYLPIVEFFKTWLNDADTQFEHVHLNLTNKFLSDCSTIKCDLFERLLNPDENFKKGEFLTLKTQVSNEQSSLFEDEFRYFPFSIENNTNKKVPIHQLKALRYLKIEGICETLLYGNSYILKASSSLRMKWREIQKNVQYFSILSSHLHQNQLALLCSIELQSNLFAKRKSFYVILPKTLNSDSTDQQAILIMKPIATRSIFLNDNLFNCQDEHCLGEVFSLTQNEINSFKSLLQSEIETLEVYNPLLISDEV